MAAMVMPISGVIPWIKGDSICQVLSQVPSMGKVEKHCELITIKTFLVFIIIFAITHLPRLYQKNSITHSYMCDLIEKATVFSAVVPGLRPTGAFGSIIYISDPHFPYI